MSNHLVQSPIEEMADFWDTHDVTDYAEYLTPVEMTIAEHPRSEYVISLSDAEDDLLQEAIQREGIPLTELINGWVQEKLQAYAASCQLALPYCLLIGASYA